MQLGQLDDIWAGDKLERRAEARMLERLLADEADILMKLGREQAFVLALDAQYGEGKSWFLSRFRSQLALNHPVAFVDAWVDDANNEPLVSIMAALEDGLKPLLRKKVIKDRLGALTRAAFPILGKALVGAGGKALARYAGDELGHYAQDAVAGAAKRGKGEGEDGAVEASLDRFTEGVSDLVDSGGKAMLDQYRKRRASRATFKENLRALSSAIGDDANSSLHRPIFLIVDELDRCRPDYAISLLEEIKHLFDVSGLVFVVALHGQQLTKSVNAVYGEGFDGKAYLRRFFSRQYALRRISIKELVASHFSEIPPNDISLAFPHVVRDGNSVSMPAPEVAGHLLSEWRATPREALSVIDGLRLFISQWDIEGVPIELPLVLILLLNAVRGENVFPQLEAPGSPEIKFFVNRSRDSQGMAQPTSESSVAFFQSYATAMSTSLPQLVRNDYRYGPDGYMGEQMSAEFARRYQNSHAPSRPPPSSWSGYRQRILQMAPFLLVEEEGTGASQ